MTRSIKLAAVLAAVLIAGSAGSAVASAQPPCADFAGTVDGNMCRVHTTTNAYALDIVFPVDYPDADILILLHRSGYRVREVPVQMRMPTGKSMHSGHHSIYYVYKMILSILVTLLRPRNAPNES